MVKSIDVLIVEYKDNLWDVLETFSPDYNGLQINYEFAKTLEIGLSIINDHPVVIMNCQTEYPKQYGERSKFIEELRLNHPDVVLIGWGFFHDKKTYVDKVDLFAYKEMDDPNFPELKRTIHQAYLDHIR